MILENVLDKNTKEELLRLSFRLKASRSDKQRSEVKGEYYASEIAKIRHLSKSELVQFIEQKRSDKGVKLGLKIAHSGSTKMYRMLDERIQQNIELMNYARNRLYSTV